jgi:hypothetical protein
MCGHSGSLTVFTVGMAAPLALPEEPQGVTAPSIPALEAIVCVGREHTLAAITAAPALGQHRRPEIAPDGILPSPQLRGHGMPRPPLIVQRPHLLMERHLSRPALSGLGLGRHRNGRWWNGHRDGAVSQGTS